jgi:regulator of PEP synthase PpsR (kinase-PPPase family)
VLEVFVVSDATGATAEAVATSVLVQFGGAPWAVRRFPFTRTVEQIDELVEQAQGQAGVVVFTLVSHELVDHLIAGCCQRRIPVVDLLSPLMSIFAGVLNHAPSRTPGAFRGQSEDMFRVTEAIRFTLDHDDGAGLETIGGAELIILGVSRTGKTPTSIYLSCRKLKVANVPIVKDMPVPEAVLAASATKVGFRMDLDRLITLRNERLDPRRLRTIPGYADGRAIAAEQHHCERLFKRIGGLCVVDVTNRSIEETSDWIVRRVL